MVGVGITSFLSVNHISEQAALEKNISCSSIIVVVDEVHHVTRIVSGHRDQSLFDGIEIEAFRLRVLIFQVTNNNSATLIERIVQMFVELAFVCAEGEFLRSHKLLDLIPVVAATLKGGTQQVGDSIQGDVVFDVDGNAWLCGCVSHNKNEYRLELVFRQGVFFLKRIL